MTNENLTIAPATAASSARLRAVGIRTADLIQIGRIFAEGDDRTRLLINALEDLGTIANGTAREGELDAALEDVAELARLDDAAMDLTPSDVRQLAEQANAALPALRAVPDAERGAA